MTTAMEMQQLHQLPTLPREALQANLAAIMNAQDGFFLQQKVEKLEALAQAFGVPYEGGNKYLVYSSDAQTQLYNALEDSTTCWRCCCAPHHKMNMNLVDSSNSVAIKMFRPFHYGCIGSCCGWNEMFVHQGNNTEDPSTLLAHIKTPCFGGGFCPKLNVLDANQKHYATIEGPFLISDMCGASFRVLSATGEQIGEIKKIRAKNTSDMAKEMFTDADKYHMNFPQNLSPEHKAGLLASLILTDYFFFEQGGAFECTGDGCAIKFCDLHCLGCLCPCKIALRAGNSGGGGGGAPPKIEEMER